MIRVHVTPDYLESPRLGLPLHDERDFRAWLPSLCLGIFHCPKPAAIVRIGGDLRKKYGTNSSSDPGMFSCARRYEKHLAISPFTRARKRSTLRKSAASRSACADSLARTT